MGVTLSRQQEEAQLVCWKLFKLFVSGYLIQTNLDVGTAHCLPKKTNLSSLAHIVYIPT